MDGKTLADHAVDYGESLGAEYVEARFVNSKNENYFARNGDFLSIQEKSSRGLGIRVLVDGCVGFGSVDVLTKDEVKNRVESISKMAKLSKRETPIEFSEEKTVQDTWKVPVNIPFKDISKEEKQDYVKRLDEGIKRSGSKRFSIRNKIKNRILFLHTNSKDKYIVNSDGSNIRSDESFISLFTILNAKVKDSSEQRMLGLGACSGWEWLKEENIHDFVVSESKKLVSTVEKSRSVNINEDIDVVVGPEVSGIMAHENVGHPSESDRIIGREEAQAGGSFYDEFLDIDDQDPLDLKQSEIKLGSDDVSVIDDPTINRSPGFYLYDEECVKARSRYLIKNGQLNELFLNREFASVFGTHSNGAARSSSYSREPIPRMSNTFFEPGDHTKEELVEDIDKGLLIESFTEWNIDDRRYHSKYVGLEAYLIKNGRVKDQMIKRPALELTTPALLNSIEGVSKDYEYRMNFCGKSDPMQPVSVSTGGPYLRIRDVRLG